MEQFDVVVIGTGPAGEGAAMMLAKNHRRVAVVERYPEVGGGCTHWGTIPSKALRHAVKTIADARNDPLLRRITAGCSVSMPQLLSTASGVTDAQVEMRRRFYERNRVPVIEGEASFVDANTLRVVSTHGEQVQLRAERFVIATGSRPYRPPGLDFSHPRVLDSDTVLRYTDTPFGMTIYGAGVIGCEYASIFLNMGVKVTLVNTLDRLLSFMDEEIAEALSYHLRDQGCIIRHNEQFDHLEARADDDVVLHLKSGRSIKSDVLLWANGRTGNTDKLNIGAVGLVANKRGQLEVDEHYRTSVPNIYAAGDVIGYPALASAAYDQGREASNAIFNKDAFHTLGEFPTGIYTIPEISTIGMNERELSEQKIPYEVGKAYFRNIARAQITGDEVGMLKLIFHFDTLEILGIHCFGDQASEILHIGQAIMNQKGGGNTLRYFLNTTFNYPTMAEAYKVAALDGINRVF